MDIIAASYKNIGPFNDKLISLNFKKGKYLIKSPIGSGKSFLFFDGPLFALYNSKNRNLLNKKSQNGYIKLLFESNNDIFLVERNIKHTKSGGESVSSKLFKIHGAYDDVINYLEDDFPNIINYSNDINKIFDKVDFDTIEFKSQNELQKTLEDFIVQKEVFLSTNFLLQDSENIFELTPVERINVFKKIFGLVGIDDSKEKISEAKKEVSTNLKLKKDTSSYDEKLRNYLSDIFNLFNEELKSFLTSNLISKLNELYYIYDKISIDKFDLSDLDFSNFNFSFEKIDKIKQDYNKEKNNLENLNQSLSKVEEDISSYNVNINNIEKKINELEEYINSLDEKQLNKLKEEKNELVQKQSDIINSLDFNSFNDFGYYPSDIYEANEAINELINEGKRLKSDLENIDNKIETITGQYNELTEKLNDLELNEGTSTYNYYLKELENIYSRYKSEIDNLNLQKKNLEDKIKGYEDRLEKLDNQLKDLDKDLDKEKKFYCEKIEDNCPFLDIIKKDSIESLENYKKQIDEISKELENIKHFFSQVDWKQIQNNIMEYKNIDNKIKEYDNKIYQMEESLKNIQSYKDELSKSYGEKKNYEKYLDNKKNEKIEIESQIKEKQKSLEKFNIDKILDIESRIETIQNKFSNIFELINDYNDLKLKIRKLEEDEKILSNLHYVFSKELMLVVLEQFLPSLEDTINSMLSQVVDYGIRFDLSKKTGEKLELDINIMDKNGLRMASSLSGGQKTILKLCWILSISSILKSNFLFLDETINNLDYESVGEVSNLIEGFIKKNDIKFFLVTHSTQIQDMEIWDEKITI